MRTALLTALLLSACHSLTPIPDPAPHLRLDYTITIEDPSANLVAVTLDLAGITPAARGLDLELPERSSFIALDAPRLAGELHANLPDGTELAVAQLSPHRYRLDTSASQLSIHWKMLLDHRSLPEVPAAFDSYEFPYLAPDHGMLFTGKLLFAPTGLVGIEGARLEVRVQLPAGWSTLAPWPERSPGDFEPPSLASIQGDILAIGTKGAWRTATVVAGGCEVTLATAPEHGDLIERLGPIVTTLVGAELELFGRRPRDHYLFLIGRNDPPPEAGSMTLAGSPKHSSMTLQVSGDFDHPMGTGLIAHLIAHEFFHTWTAPDHPYPDELRFISEGFTDYYAFLIAARTELIDWQTFADELAGKLAEYAASAQGLSLQDAGGPAFFEGRAASTVTYAGGLLFAAVLDQELRVSPSAAGIDDFMRALNNGLEAGQGPDLERFTGLLNKYLGAERAARLERITSAPGAIDFPALLRGLGVSVAAQVSTEPPSLRANLRGNVVADIDPTGLAARIGVLSGDRLLLVNGQPCQTESEVRAAWSLPQAGRMTVELVRGQERLLLDEPLAPDTEYSLDGADWATPPHLAEPNKSAPE